MSNRESALGPLLVAAVGAIALAYFVTHASDNTHSDAARPKASAAGTPAPVATEVATTQPAPARTIWAVSAPGRVEPKGGEVKISPMAAGRVVDVMVGVNDKVITGDLLIRLEDSDIEARIAAADAEASVRKRDRDTEVVTGPAKDRRTAEDAAFAAERLYSLNRSELDRWLIARRNGLTTDAEVAKARETVVKARETMEAARLALRRMLADTTLPAQTRLESALAAARAELASIDAVSERARIRAPIDGTVLQVGVRVGESVAPSPENVVMVLGNVSSLRVKTEIEERDVGKIHKGQAAVIRSDAFPGRDFDGVVSSFGQSLAPSQIGQKGPRRLVDGDVLEMIVDVTGQTPLLPGMRVDVFLKPETTASQPQPKSN